MVIKLTYWQGILAWINSFIAGDILFDTPTYYPGAPYSLPPDTSRHNLCIVEAPPDSGDAVPAIIEAFTTCGRNGRIVFPKGTYYVNSVMNTTGLSNVEVDIQGTLIWSSDIPYWLNHSLPVGYQEQYSAWIFGGDRVWLHGDGVGTLNGSGQVWYNFVKCASNYPRRPHQITFNHLTNSVIESLRFWQSQMWTMTLIRSNNVLLQDIHVNNTNLNGGCDMNTDGADTIFSNNITFTRWTVQNGDDHIATKANSTNILIEDCNFIHGTGIAIGSVGQYPNQWTQVTNVTARNINMTDSYFAAYIKTWTGKQKGIPPNGGGGGTGIIKNLTFDNFNVSGLHQAFSITQCLSYNGATGDCDTSTMQISDLTLQNVHGTQQATNVTTLQCSGAAPCTNVQIHDVHLFTTQGDHVVTSHACDSVDDAHGFKCTARADKSSGFT